MDDVLHLQKLKQELFDDVQNFQEIQKRSRLQKEANIKGAYGAIPERLVDKYIKPNVQEKETDEKDEYAVVLEEELQPMSYAKVFSQSNDK